MSKEVSGNKPFVVFVHLHSDRSLTSLMQTGVSAYLPYSNFKNFSYDSWKTRVRSQQTVSAYLPNRSICKENGWKMSEVCYSNTSFLRVLKMELLYKA